MGESQADKAFSAPEAPEHITTPDRLARELAAEQVHVDRVYAQLEIDTASARQIEREGRSRYLSDRADFLREEHGTALFERDAFAFQAARRLASLDTEHEGLVFGRIDLTDGEARHIGRLGVRDDDYEPLVIDWRAPAAEPFYRATANNPLEVIRRRVLRTRGEKVVGIEDDLLDSSHATTLPIIGEGALMAALTRARGPQMRDIVATIQSEQDKAIRAPYQGVTIITGGPGTGKTVVALHRAAYLLYTNRKRLEKGGVLVVGPSALFMNYIERVLPSLGEDSVTLRSIGSMAIDTLGFVAERNDSAAAAAIKGSPRMLTLLRRVVSEPLVDDLAQPLRATVKGDVLILDRTRLQRIRRDVLATHQLNRGRPAAEHAILNALWHRFDTGGSRPPDLDRDQFDDLVQSQAGYRMFLNAWWPTVTPRQALGRLGDRDLLDTLASDLLNDQERDVLAASYDHVDLSVPDRLAGAQFTISDIALLDELATLVGRAPDDPDDEPEVFVEGGEIQELVTMADWLRDERGTDENDEDPVDTFAHVLVDEAQDITPMQWRMVRRRGPQASWTLVGDLAQSSWPDVHETGAAIRELVGSAPSRSFELRINYRSPAEVFELAGQVITHAFPEASLPRAVRHTGIDPELLQVPRDRWVDVVHSLIDRLADEVEGTIGIIIPPSLIAHLDHLPARHPARSRLAVLTPLQSKGLEYDAVVVVSPDDIVAESSGGERVLYVALTRPTQRLVTIDIIDPFTTGDSRAAWRESLG